MIRKAVIFAGYGSFFAAIECTWFHAIKARDMWVIGSDRRCNIDFHNNVINCYDPKKKLQSQTFVLTSTEEPLEQELRHFINCAEVGKVPINSGWSGYKAILLCEKALESAEKKMTVEVKE